MSFVSVSFFVFVLDPHALCFFIHVTNKEGKKKGGNKVRVRLRALLGLLILLLWVLRSCQWHLSLLYCTHCPEVLLDLGWRDVVQYLVSYTSMAQVSQNLVCCCSDIVCCFRNSKWHLFQWFVLCAVSGSIMNGYSGVGANSVVNGGSHAMLANGMNLFSAMPT